MTAMVHFCTVTPWIHPPPPKRRGSARVDMFLIRRSAEVTEPQVQLNAPTHVPDLVVVVKMSDCIMPAAFSLII